jgi:diamine N-acetyltransferase
MRSERVRRLRNMQIRKVDTRDLATLSELAMQTYADAFGHSFSSADLAAHLEKNLSPKKFERMLEEDTVLVAEVNARMVGFVQFGPGSLSVNDGLGDEQELRRLYVQAEFQNKGIGAMLMNAALEHPSLRRAECVYLDVWEHNPGAQRFYARHGFEVIEKRRFIAESGAEGDFDLIMVRHRVE